MSGIAWGYSAGDSAGPGRLSGRLALVFDLGFDLDLPRRKAVRQGRRRLVTWRFSK